MGNSVGNSRFEYTNDGTGAVTKVVERATGREMDLADQSVDLAAVLRNFSTSQDDAAASGFSGLFGWTIFGRSEDLVAALRDWGKYLCLESSQSIYTGYVGIPSPPTRLCGNVMLYKLCEAHGEGITVIPKRLRWMVTGGAMNTFQQQLADPMSPASCVSAVTVTRTFVYFDISDFSTYPAMRQAQMISAVGALLRRPVVSDSSWHAFEESICIGDGFIFVFSSPVTAIHFASTLACLIERIHGDKSAVEMHYRIGIHTGEVFRFWDGLDGSTPLGSQPQGRWNYVGDGINDGRRVLEAIGKKSDDVVYLSSAARAAARAEYPNWGQVPMRNMGRRLDKHGKPHRVYEVDHITLGDGEAITAELAGFFA